MEAYEVIQTVGRGAFARVDLARSASGRILCIKRFTTCLGELSPRGRTELALEVKLLAHLEHPGIVKFEEFFIDSDGSASLVMEYCAGGTLHAALESRRGELLPEERVWEALVQLASALRYVHANGVLHRDIKSNNILLAGPPPEYRVLKLGDFGIAKVLGDTRELAATVVGTPFYLSPEVAQGRAYDIKSDVWALGVVLYEMLALHRPFEASNLPAVIFAIMRAALPPLPLEFSAELRGLVSALMAKDPADRPSMDEVMALPVVQHYFNRWCATQGDLEMEAEHDGDEGRSSSAGAGGLGQTPTPRQSTAEQHSMPRAPSFTGSGPPGLPAATPLGLSTNGGYGLGATQYAGARGTPVASLGSVGGAFALPMPSWAVRKTSSDLSASVVTAHAHPAVFGQGPALPPPTQGAALPSSTLPPSTAVRHVPSFASLPPLPTTPPAGGSTRHAPWGSTVSGLPLAHAPTGQTTAEGSAAGAVTCVVKASADPDASTDPAAAEVNRVRLWLERIYDTVGRFQLRRDIARQVKGEALGHAPKQLLPYVYTYLPGDTEGWDHFLDGVGARREADSSAAAEGSPPCDPASPLVGGAGVPLSALERFADTLSRLPPDVATFALGRVELLALQTEMVEEDVELRRAGRTGPAGVSVEPGRHDDVTDHSRRDEIQDAGGVAGVVWEALARAWSGVSAWHMSVRCMRQAAARRHAPFPPALNAVEVLGSMLVRTAVLVLTLAQAGHPLVAATVAHEAYREPEGKPAGHGRVGSAESSTGHGGAHRTVTSSTSSHGAAEEAGAAEVDVDVHEGRRRASFSSSSSIHPSHVPSVLEVLGDVLPPLEAAHGGSTVDRRRPPGDDWHHTAREIMSEGIRLITRVISLGATRERYLLAADAYRNRAWAGMQQAGVSVTHDLEEAVRLHMLAHELEAECDPVSPSVHNLVWATRIQTLLIHGKEQDVRKLQAQARDAEHWADVRKSIVPSDIYRWVTVVDARCLRFLLGDTEEAGEVGRKQLAVGGKSKGPVILDAARIAQEYRSELAIGMNDPLWHATLGELQWVCDVARARRAAIAAGMEGAPPRLSREGHELPSSCSAGERASTPSNSTHLPGSGRSDTPPVRSSAGGGAVGGAKGTPSRTAREDSPALSTDVSDGLVAATTSGEDFVESDVLRLNRQSAEWLQLVLDRAEAVLGDLLVRYAPSSTIPSAASVVSTSSRTQEAGFIPGPLEAHSGGGPLVVQAPVASNKEERVAQLSQEDSAIAAHTVVTAQAPAAEATGRGATQGVAAGGAAMLTAITEESPGYLSVSDHTERPVRAATRKVSQDAPSFKSVVAAVLPPAAPLVHAVPTPTPVHGHGGVARYADPARAAKSEERVQAEQSAGPGAVAPPGVPAGPAGPVPLASMSATHALAGPTAQRQVPLAEPSTHPFRPSPLATLHAASTGTLQDHLSHAEEHRPGLGPRAGWHSASHLQVGVHALPSTSSLTVGGGGVNPFARSTPHAMRFSPPTAWTSSGHPGDGSSAPQLTAQGAGRDGAAAPAPPLLSLLGSLPAPPSAPAVGAPEEGHGTAADFSPMLPMEATFVAATDGGTAGAIEGRFEAVVDTTATPRRGIRHRLRTWLRGGH